MMRQQWKQLSKQDPGFSINQNSVKIHKTKCKFPQKNPIRLSKHTKITSYTDETDNQAKRCITYQ